MPPTLPTRIRADRTLRVKIIDACGLACTFCHNEGTPVATDNLGRRNDSYVGNGRSGRVSIYLGANGARFLPATVAPDESFVAALRILRLFLDVDELHLTGGEPTLHPRLADVVRAGRDAGYRVCMTSNGENGSRTLPACAAAGLDRVNFSIFGTTGTELVEVQGARFANAALAERKVEATRQAITTALGHGIRASANIVVPSLDQAPRVRRLLDEFGPGLSVRLLNSLDAGETSTSAIAIILRSLGAISFERQLVAGVSGCRTAYRLPSGRVIVVKEIRPVRLEETCRDCVFNNGVDCHEGFYGVRLYRDRSGGFQVGVCIQRMDLCLPLEEFLRSGLPREILALRESEYRLLAAA